MKMNYKKRLINLIEGTKKAELDGFIVNDSVNIRYFTGLDCSNGILHIKGDKSFFYTDFRYIERALKIPSIIGGDLLEIRESERDLFKSFSDSAGKAGKVGFEPENISHLAYLKLKENIKGELLPKENLANGLRAFKEKAEVDKIIKAQRIAEKALKELLPHMREVGDSGAKLTEIRAAALLDSNIRLGGAQGNSFDTMVACGANGARPHSVPGHSPLRVGRPIIIDFGALVDGYCSDMTRSLFIGKAEKKDRGIYNAVLKAQMAALSILGPDITGAQADMAARKVLEEYGLEKYFRHGLGHGLGMKVHEAPSVSQAGKEKLMPGMVVTVEPGVYIKGWGGIRIEDMALITEDGHKRLTNMGKKLEDWII